MGLLRTRWEAHHGGHRIAVVRNEFTKGFRLEWDGQEVARRAWSLLGLGELHATVVIDGKPTEVRMVLDATFRGTGPGGQCRIEIAGESIPVRRIK